MLIAITPLAALPQGPSTLPTSKVPFADLAKAGLEVSGDPAVAGRFVDLFHLPPKAG